MTYWVTGKGTYHWTFDCPSLRRGSISKIQTTEHAPTETLLLCLDCFNRVGSPPGFVPSSPLPSGTMSDKVGDSAKATDERNLVTKEGYRIALLMTAPCKDIREADDLAIDLLDGIREQFPQITVEPHGVEALDEETNRSDRRNPGELEFAVHVKASGSFYAPDAEWVHNRIERELVSFQDPVIVVVRKT